MNIKKFRDSSALRFSMKFQKDGESVKMKNEVKSSAQESLII